MKLIERYPAFCHQKVFFPVDDRKDFSSMSTDSLSGLPNPIKKPIDLKRVVHGYAAILRTIRSFAEHPWYMSAKVEVDPFEGLFSDSSSSDDDDSSSSIEGLFSASPKRPKEEETPENVVVKKQKTSNFRVPEIGRHWIKSWHQAGIAPTDCREMIGRDELRSNIDELVETPMMRLVWSCLRYCENQGALVKK